MSEKRTVVIVGDAVCTSGFARCTHAAADSFHSQGWRVVVMGMNYNGDPHDYPYDIYPARVGNDLYGVTRLPHIVNKHTPEVVLVLNDSWNIEPYVTAAGNVPVVGWVAVDSKNIDGACMNGLAGAIFWTEFAVREARLGGYVGSAVSIPLGVDTTAFRPRDRAEARIELGLPARVHDAYIIGRVDRNQPRKRWDLQAHYFCTWAKEYEVRDAYLYAHLAPTGDIGVDIESLMRYYGLSSRLILCAPPITHAFPEEKMALTYAAMDMYWTTSQAEGWGLGTMEAMASGIPCMVPRWSALGEWPAQAAVMVECTNIALTAPQNGHLRTIGGVPDMEESVKKLAQLYEDKELREHHGKLGLELVRQPQFQWDSIGDEVVKATEQAVGALVLGGDDRRVFEAAPQAVADLAMGGG